MKTPHSLPVAMLFVWIGVIGPGPLRGHATEAHDSAKGQRFSLLSVPNQLPQVQIVFPPPHVIFGYADSIQIRARAFDPDGTISQVQFFAGTNLIGIVTNAP